MSAPAAATRFDTLVELLRHRALEQPDALAYRFLSSGDAEGGVEEWSYGELELRVRSVAARLQAAGAAGERTLLLFPPGLDFVAAFLGCLYAGTVAVPAYPPRPRPDSTLLRLRAIARDSGARFVLTTPEIQAMAGGLQAFAPEMGAARWLAAGPADDGAADAWRPPAVDGGTLAFLQYTSGSTGTPKGVMNTHANLLHNEGLITRGFGLDSASHVVGWLPLFHDMGLIGNVLQPLCLGGACTLMSPLAFMQRPLRWLEAVSRYRGTVSGGPNFAFDLCAARVKPHERERLDLSAWAVAYNGAEPIRVETMERFAAAFAACGFRADAFYPCYGLAEATLFVTGADRRLPPVVRAVRGDALAGGRAVDALPGEPSERALVSSGRSGEGQEVVVADPETRLPCPARTVGEIWVSGPSVAAGYWNRPEESGRVFGARLADDPGGRAFLRTGDLGFLLGGELFVTGRLKDMIILRGRNLYPQDVEAALEQAHPAVRPGGCAAFALEAGGEERLGVAAEVEPGADPGAVAEALRRAVAESHGAHAHAVVLLKPRSIPKTSSGKIQRHACRDGFARGTLDEVARSVEEGASPLLPGAEYAASPLGPALEGAAAGERARIVEELVVRQVARALRVEAARVELSTAPASLGIDSLMAVELQTSLETAVGVSLPAGFLGARETLGGAAAALLAAWEARGAPEGEGPALPPLVPAPLEGELPVSSGQRRLLFLEKMAGGVPVYHLHFGLRLTGPLDAGRLARALDRVAERHPALRTVFRETDGEPFQVVLPHAGVRLVPLDLRGTPAAGREEALRRAAAELAAHPFDLERGPLLRTHLAVLGADEHVLLLAQHHAVTDGWSVARLGSELAAAYAALADGAPLPPAPRLSFADYARWERAAGRGRPGDRDYWERRLAGLPRLELPADRPPAAHPSFRGGRVPLALPRETAARLAALGRDEGCTLFATLAAAYAALLHRYTGDEDFAVGTVAANRARPELREVIGFFANTVVLRCDLSGAPSFRGLLGRMRSAASEALAHGELPFAEVVTAAGGAAEGPGNPLFQAGFVLERNPVGEMEVAGMRWRPLSWSPDGAVEGTAKFDLSLAMEETPAGVGGTLEYAADRFDRGTVERMAAHLAILWRALADAPDAPVGTLPLLDLGERERVLRGWNDTAAPLPDESFPALFARQAARTPDAVAVVDPFEHLTYAGLEARAGRLARRFRRAGAAPESVVALLMERGAGFLASVLALFRTGSAYLPLDPADPPARHREVLARAGVTLVVTSRALAPSLAGEPAPWRAIAIDGPESADALDASGGVNGADRADAFEAWGGVGDADRADAFEASGGVVASDETERGDADHPVSGDGLAYVIFTSGSTGAPKGAMVEHRGMLNHLVAKLRDLEMGPGDVVAQTASQCFDISVWQLLAPLLAGGTVRVVPPEVAGDPERLFRDAAEGGVTVLEVVPSLLRAALEALDSRGERGFGAPALRWLLLTGEALPPELAREWLERHPAIPLLNAYGPTECSDDVAHHPLRRPDEAGGAYTPIGRPIVNTRLYVLDRAMEPVPAGVPGELYVGGVCVGRGYLREPARTARAFVPDPFGGAGERLYRTGDRARRLATGELVFLGRADHQVKVRGFRVELGEVEAALAEHPAVREGVVLARGDAPGDRRLVAYCVLRRPTPPAELRDALARRLPSYMVPSIFVPVDAMPLTANGKLDRRALPAPPRDASGEGYVPPRTPAEEAVAAVWAEVLGTDRVGAEDDFFALGGHSLLATRVAARLRARLGVELPLRALFEARTVAALAAAAERARGAGGPAAPALERVPRDGGVPLSFAQRRLWFLDQLAPGDPSYNVPGALRIRGPLDAGALSRALGEIVRRHEALRTTFAAVDGEPVQRVAPAAPFALDTADLRAHADPEGEAGARMRAEASRPFDLARGPLLRATLLRLAGEDHLLVLVMHHVASDGWSLGVLAREASALYEAFAAGRPSPLPELPVQYADFAAWQRRWLAEGALERQLGYWRARLEGIAPALELPTDRPRPAARSHRGGHVPAALEPELVRGLRALCAAHGATLYMGLLAAFQALLHRYTGQDDLAVGSPVAGRPRPELEGLIGFFVNTLVLRADFSDDPAFDTLLARVRESTLDAFAHPDLPFETLVEAIDPPRDPGRTPLVQAMLILQNAPPPRLALGAARLETAAVDNGTAKFDLTLTLEESGEGLGGVLEYAADLFDASTARRMVEHFRTLLEAAVARPGTRAGELPLVSAAERRRMVEACAGAEAPVPPGGIAALFEAQAARTPDGVALLGPDAPVTYAALNARANRVAWHLRALGAGPGTRVGVHLPRSPECVAAVLGVLKSGAAYVPLDVGYPAERLRHMLDAGRIAVVLGGEARRAEIEPEGAAVAWVDVGGPALAAGRQDDPPHRTGPGDEAYVIFTSGSTGVPNGVVGLHGGAVNRFAWMWDRHPFAPGEVAALKTATSFVDSVWETFGPLLRGVPSVVLADETVRDPGALVRALGEAGVTRIVLVPSLLRALLEEGPGLGARLPRLRHWTSSGEPLPPDLARLFARRLPGRTLLNLYGQSEASADSTAYVVPGEVGARVPIGRPLHNTQVYVLDRRMEPVPPGVVGEIHVGGAGLARGYLFQPARTAARFVPDPLSGRPGARLYRTGDLGRWRADGELEYAGRADRQVKLRGMRIDPAEVEAALRRHPGVAEAAVALHGAGGAARLAAYVVSAGDAPADMGALRRHLAGSLPAFMVPAAWVALDRLPLTPSGKIDRRALPAPPREASADVHVPPRTPAEEAVAAVWGEVLGVDRVGAEDDFFALGGHSLVATRVAARLGARLGVELPLRVLFEARTVAALAAAAERAREGAAAEDAAPPLERVPRDGDLPLSSAQRRLWFLDQLDPGDPSYNVPGALRIRGPLDAGALSRTLGEIVRRHESLRTTFAAADGEPAQRIAPAAPFALDAADLRSAADPEGEARARTAAEASRPFDLARGPLLRATLLRLGDEDHLLVLVVHHVASDGWSLGVLAREAAALYEAFAAGRPSPLPELPVQYADFAAWQRRWMAGGALERQLEWWRARLEGMPPALELPTDRPRSAARSRRGGRVPAVLEPELAGALRALCAAHGATLFMGLLAGFQALLHRYTGEDDLAVGSPVAGRSRPELEGLIGFFVNTLVLRADLSGDPGFDTLLSRVRESTLDAFAHPDLPFETLVEAIDPPRDPGRTPLVQAVLALQPALSPVLEMGGARAEIVDADGGSAKFDLTLSLRDDGERVDGYLEYDADLFDPATAARMVEHFRRLLAGAVADPGAAAASLPLLDPAERRAIVEGWSGGAGDGEESRGVHERFAEQAARTPGAVAVVDADGAEVTYAELDRRAGRLAGYLRGAGVGAETLVALALERSADGVTAALAVLRAGGAYLPLDLGAPPERLARVLDDARPALVLAHAAVEARLPAGAAPVVFLERERAAIDAAPPAAPAPVAGDRLAYVMYTSGSTGRPKGVCVPHRGVVRLARAAPYLRLDGDDRVLHMSSPAFDASTFELWAPLLNGARVVVAPPGTLSLEEIGDLVRRSGVTVAWLTAPLFHQVVDESPAGLAGVRALLAGGDVLSPRHVRRARERLPECRVINGYGPTENTTFTCCGPADEDRGDAPVPIGRPVGGTRVYLLDGRMEPVPAGVPGELYAGGDGVARGYLGAPGRTAAAFVPDPFGAPGGRLYRTGDRARWLPDGRVEFLGRADQQVKVRGFRVEPAEVEAALEAHPAVARAVVVTRGAPGEKALVACYVPRGEADDDALRQALRLRLPEFMLPSAFVAVPALPLTPTGKVDRRALAALAAGAGPASRAYRAPRTGTETRLAAIWAEALGVERVGVDDDFFALGGHSLVATRVMARVHDAFGARVPLRDLFERPTVAALARALDAGAAPRGPAPAPIARARRELVSVPLDPEE